tara:strand:+ start:9137 stop:9256 length:120 start_codon:yes stop_codon:yes gene_type:complete
MTQEYSFAVNAQLRRYFDPSKPPELLNFKACEKAASGEN